MPKRLGIILLCYIQSLLVQLVLANPVSLPPSEISGPEMVHNSNGGEIVSPQKRYVES